MQIPGFEIIQELSRGPVTSVYVVRNENGKILLLKTLHPQHARDPEIYKRFRREAEVIKRLDHINIVKVHDHSTYQDIPYTIMAYVHGWNLRDFISRNHPLPAGIVQSIGCQFLEALAYAHKNSVIHRDIKPSNILIGIDGVVKLTDFGLARPQDLSAITEQGDMIGTPGYTAPEILQGESSSVQSDIFSAGVTLYEMLSGSNPYKGESVAVSIHNIMNLNPPRLSPERKDLPEELEQSILRMISREPSERPPDVDHILREIGSEDNMRPDKYLANFIASSVKHDIPAPPSDPVKGKRVKRNLIAAGLVLIFVVFVLVYFGSDRNMPVSDTATSGKNSERLTVVDTVFRSPAMTDPDAPGGSGRTDHKAQNINKTVNALADTQRSADAPVKAGMNKTPGGIFITAIPWAYLKINGVIQDTTPMTDPVMLPDGEYVISLENPAYQVYRKKVTVSAGQIDSMTVTLSEKYGYLKISVVPWGEIYLNDHLIETTPLKSPVRVEEGHYSLTVKNPYFKPYRREIDIRSGETETIVVYLE
jgi:serine/threonine protein kinase